MRTRVPSRRNGSTTCRITDREHSSCELCPDVMLYSKSDFFGFNVRLCVRNACPRRSSASPPLPDLLPGSSTVVGACERSARSRL
eukprot:6248674-Prymnesium_polylepis.2